MMKIITRKWSFKNILLLLLPLISQLKTLFYGQDLRVDWYLFTDHTKRIDFAVFYLTLCINFLILSYCLYFPIGIIKDIKKFVLIICFADLVHLVLHAGIGFGMVKYVLCTIAFLLMKINELYGWQKQKTY